MKPIGEYIKIKRIPKENTGKIITALEGATPLFEENAGILVYTTTIDDNSPSGSEVVLAGTKVLFANPAFERKEGEDTFAYVNKKYLIAHGG